jgi:hypothetical protein
MEEVRMQCKIKKMGFKRLTFKEIMESAMGLENAMDSDAMQMPFQNAADCATDCYARSRMEENVPLR